MTDKTKLIILTSPSNPTGAVYSREELQKIAGFAVERDLLIMSDRSSALEPFDFAVLKFTDEKELKPILDMYQNNGKPSGPLTRGLYFRGAE